MIIAVVLIVFTEKKQKKNTAMLPAILPNIQLMVSPLQQGAKRAAIKILKNFDEAITVDAASLDPESLYQRPYAGWVLCV